MSILDTIKPIQLLHGHHSDTGVTGSGCFMDVIAYLNGEAQITDKSPCVHPLIRNRMIECNDALAMRDRQKLIQFVPRAMDSAYVHGDAIEKFEAVMHMFSTAAYAKAEQRVRLFEQRVSGNLFGKNGPGAGPFRDVAYWLEQAKGSQHRVLPVMRLAESLDRVQAEVRLERYQAPRYDEIDNRMIHVETRTVEHLQPRLLSWLLLALDAALPPANEPTQQVIARAEKLVAVHNENEAAKAAKIALARAGA